MENMSGETRAKTHCLTEREASSRCWTFFLNWVGCSQYWQYLGPAHPGACKRYTALPEPWHVTWPHEYSERFFTRVLESCDAERLSCRVYCQDGEKAKLRGSIVRCMRGVG